MSAYVIYDVDIHDMTRYRDYMQQVQPAIEAAGGRYLARGGPHKVYEGDWEPKRLVLFEFPSTEALETFYTSPAYLSIKPIRDECSSARLIAVEGLP